MSKQDPNPSGPELEHLRAAWQNGPPAPDLAAHLTEEVRRDSNRMLALVQCDVLERHRLADAPTWQDEDLTISVEHYRRALGTIEPGTSIARIVIEYELRQARNRSEDDYRNRIAELSKNFKTDVDAVVQDLDPDQETGSIDMPPTDLRPDQRDRHVCPTCKPKPGQDRCRYRYRYTKDMKIGEYVLQAPLGHGGMGEVWKGKRESTNQDVAVKFTILERLKHDDERQRFLRYFDREREALTRLGHPGIARIYAADFLDDGNPYIVMSYVSGEPITDVCDRACLGIEQRLRLMAEICDAVQYMHNMNVMHRDLKPQNVLVACVKGENERTEYRPFIIDLGLAKEIDAEKPLTAQRTDTSFHSPAGTWAYMSPEQIVSGQLGVTQQTDVFALGVMLYELLAGVLPIDPKDVLQEAQDRFMQELLRLLCDPDARPEPLTRFLSSDEQNRSDIAKRRHMSMPKELAKRLKGRLRHLPMTAMRHQPPARFKSAASMARDIRNYLEDKDFDEAAAEPRWDKAIRRIKRHKLAYASAALIALSLIGGITATTWQWQIAQANEQRAETQTTHALAAQKRAEDAQKEEAKQRQVAEDERNAALWQSYLANLAAAEVALKEGEFARAQRRLDACPEHLRHWEWWHLSRTHPIKFALHGHEGEVVSAAFSPDGTRIVTASHDSTARVWNAATGDELVALPGHEREVVSAAFSPYGTRIVTASRDSTARVWDATSGSELVILPGHGGEVVSAAFSPDGIRIVTASHDGTARVWDATTGDELVILPDHEREVVFAAFSPDGTHILTVSTDRTARVWDAAAGDELFVLRGRESTTVSGTLRLRASGVLSAAFSPDGMRIVTASEDDAVRVWDAATGDELRVLRGHNGSVESAAFSPDGMRIVTASRDGTARVWASDTGSELFVLRGHRSMKSAFRSVVSSAVFSPDGTRIVTASDDRTTRVWDAATGDELLVLRGHDGSVKSAAFSPDGMRIVTAAHDGTARVWASAAGSEHVVLLSSWSFVWSAAISPGGTRIVAVGRGNTARVWDAATGDELLVLHGHEGEVLSAAFSPDGTRIVTASRDGTARVWDATTGDELVVLPGHKGAVGSAAFSSDGTRIITASEDGTLRVWVAVTGDELFVRHGYEGGVRSAAFSPDGTRIVGVAGGTARVWHAATGNTLFVLRGHGGRVRSADFSSDGTRIVTVSFGDTAQVWGIATGSELFVLRGHEGGVRSAAFSPDGTRIVTASHDGTARVWDATTGDELVVLPDHEREVVFAAFSPDGTRIITASGDRTIRVWDSVPDRIRHAEREANARGEDGSAIVRAWLAEHR